MKYICSSWIYKQNNREFSHNINLHISNNNLYQYFDFDKLVSTYIWYNWSASWQNRTVCNLHSYNYFFLLSASSQRSFLNFYVRNICYYVHIFKTNIYISIYRLVLYTETTINIVYINSTSQCLLVNWQRKWTLMEQFVKRPNDKYC